MGIGHDTCQEKCLDSTTCRHACDISQSPTPLLPTDDRVKIGSDYQKAYAKSPSKHLELNTADEDDSYKFGFPNRWHPHFLTPRVNNDYVPVFDIKASTNSRCNHLDIFFSDYGDTASQCVIAVVENFCQGTNLDDVVNGKGTMSKKSNVWLHERECIPGHEESGKIRRNQNPLCPTELYHALKKRRVAEEGLPDATRRRIYINDLDPACVHALAATASCQETPVLRNAIYNHLHYQCEIAVGSLAGFLNFELALHLPFLVIRQDPPPTNLSKPPYTQPQRQWMDLSFLEIDDPDSAGVESKKGWALHEAHMSCVVTGSDQWNFVVYGFFETDIDGEMQDSFESDLDFEPDPITFGELDATIAMEGPREYWLKVFATRIRQVAIAWADVIHYVEIGINRYTTIHTFTLSSRPDVVQEKDAELRAAFEWSLKALKLLRRLDDLLSNVLETWKGFSAPEGNIGNFDDTTLSPMGRRSVHSIRASFQKLEALRRRISNLNKCRDEFCHNLNLRLTFENKEATDGSGSISEFTVIVLYPVALAASIFSMQQFSPPFALTPSSFTLTCLSLMAALYAIRLLLQLTRSRLVLSHRKIMSWYKVSKQNLDVKEDGLRLHAKDAYALGTRILRGPSIKRSKPHLEIC